MKKLIAKKLIYIGHFGWSSPLYLSNYANYVTKDGVLNDLEREKDLHSRSFRKGDQRHS